MMQNNVLKYPWLQNNNYAKAVLQEFQNNIEIEEVSRRLFQLRTGRD